MTDGTQIKICCIASAEEAGLAMQHGATALGLVSEMPSGPGSIPESRIARIARRLPPDITSVLLTARTRASEIIAQQRRTGVNTVQLVDALTEEESIALREGLPFTNLIQVVHVVDEGAIEAARAVEKHVDFLLLDSGRPDLAVKQLGGTGRVHDWSISRRIRDGVGIPVFLAGGLNAENVRAAIDTVHPHGVDVCTGVRTDGHLDPRKLHAFVQAIGHIGKNCC